MITYCSGVDIDPQFPVRGSVLNTRRTPGPKTHQSRAEHLARQRMCMARLKAERTGKATSFPPRIRRMR